MFQCHSLKTSHPLPLPQSPKDCSIHLCLFCCLAYRIMLLSYICLLWLSPYSKPKLGMLSEKICACSCLESEDAADHPLWRPPLHSSLNPEVCPELHHWSQCWHRNLLPGFAFSYCSLFQPLFHFPLCFPVFFLLLLLKELHHFCFSYWIKGVFILIFTNSQFYITRNTFQST